MSRIVGNRSKITVGLVQVNNSFSGQNYLPYSVGLLQAYVNRYAADPSRYAFLPLIYRREKISDVIDTLSGADMVGFSTYVWNGRISLETARRLKARNPNVLIVFGGPHVPDQPEGFLRQHPVIDVVVHNEGEKTFLQILETLPSRDWSGLAGVSYVTSAGDFRHNPNGPRFRDLDEVPSPFLEGTFDSLIAQNPDEIWIGLWETNRGCPFKCTFCDWGSATAAKVNKFGMERLKAEADWFARNKIEYIFCCDANFGIQKRDVDISKYVAGVKKKTGYPHRLSVQNTKNATERAYLTQKILSDANLNQGVAISMQSVDTGTLEAIKRDNISLDSYMELHRRFTRDGVETYSDLILGLPGETYESFANGVNLLIKTGQHNRIQFNNLAILPNAEMGDPAYQKKYGMVTVQSEIINLHGQRIEYEDDVAEVQDLVIATAAMPHDDWRRTRAFCWMTALLHFDKLLQIPMIMAHELTGLIYRDIIENFLDTDGADYPIIAEIRDFFLAEARAMQAGGPEYVYSAEWLGVYWPTDEYIFIKLTAERRIDQFYDEAGRLLASLVQGRTAGNTEKIIAEAVKLNRALVKQPFVSDDITLETSYDLLSFYNGIRHGKKQALIQTPSEVLIDRSSKVYDDFSDWCREVVWWGNKKGAYLYTNRSYVKQLAGHY